MIDTNLSSLMHRLLSSILLHCLLTLSLLWGWQTAFAAIQQETRTLVTSTHCAAPSSTQQHNQLPALDCLGHCALPAQLVDTPTALQYRQQGLSLPPVRFLSIVQTPPSPPPKFSAV